MEPISDSEATMERVSKDSTSTLQLSLVVSHPKTPILNSLYHLLWFYFLTVSEFSCLAKSFSVSGLTPFFLRHGGPPPKALHQSGLTMGKSSVHGEPKFSEGQPRVFTNLVRVKTLHELHNGPEKVKILVEAISVKDAEGYIAYTKAK